MCLSPIDLPKDYKPVDHSTMPYAVDAYGNSHPLALGEEIRVKPKQRTSPNTTNTVDKDGYNIDRALASAEADASQVFSAKSVLAKARLIGRASSFERTLNIDTEFYKSFDPQTRDDEWVGYVYFQRECIKVYADVKLLKDEIYERGLVRQLYIKKKVSISNTLVYATTMRQYLRQIDYKDKIKEFLNERV
jgi:hypothetical protein